MCVIFKYRVLRGSNVRALFGFALDCLWFAGFACAAAVASAVAVAVFLFGFAV